MAFVMYAIWKFNLNVFIKLNFEFNIYQECMNMSEHEDTIAHQEECNQISAPYHTKPALNRDQLK